MALVGPLMSCRDESSSAPTAVMTMAVYSPYCGGRPAMLRVGHRLRHRDGGDGQPGEQVEPKGVPGVRRSESSAGTKRNSTSTARAGSPFAGGSDTGGSSSSSATGNAFISSFCGKPSSSAAQCITLSIILVLYRRRKAKRR